jgi:LysR family transcriptional activator of nhaA
MDWLNYHHLFYFHQVARTGSVTAAARELGIRQPTISAQIKQLEEALSVKLFERRGRGLVLTEEGRVASAFADEIFRLGRDLRRALETNAGAPVRQAIVGISDTVAKTVVKALLEPLLAGEERPRLVLREAPEVHLFAALEQSELDVVLTDHRPPVGQRFDERLVLETPLTLYAADPLHARLAEQLPRLPDDLPMLLPGEGAPTRRRLEDWFYERDVRLDVVAEVDDSALAKILAAAGGAAVAAPALIAESVQAQFHLKPLTELEGLSERYLAYTSPRRREHGPTLAILEAFEAARQAIG